jgi:uncharacterized membrane protein
VKILLLNDNPVVNKLVTLSAQKTSDELDIVQSLDDIVNDAYDLVVVDDSIGGSELLDELRKKLVFSKSLYICARDAQGGEKFNTTLKKPFLPTDLVELFSMFDKEIEKATNEEPLQEQSVEEELQESLEIEDIEDLDGDATLELDDLGEIEALDELDDFEEIALDEQVELDSEALELDIDGATDDETLELD